MRLIKIPKSYINRKYLTPVLDPNAKWTGRQVISDLIQVHYAQKTEDFLKPLPESSRPFVVCRECGECKALYNENFICMNGHGKLEPVGKALWSVEKRSTLRLATAYVTMSLKPRFTEPVTQKPKRKK